VCDTGIEIVIGSPLSQACENAKRSVLALVLQSTGTEKSTKKPLQYARLAVKPNNMLSSVGNSLGKKEGQLHEPLTLHWVPGIDE
jgi:hypothetical protein